MGFEVNVSKVRYDKQGSKLLGKPIIGAPQLM